VSAFLLTHRVSVAKKPGVKRLAAMILPENTPMEGAIERPNGSLMVTRDEDEVRYMFIISAGVKPG
jgi:hypothetical protein